MPSRTLPALLATLALLSMAPSHAEITLQDFHSSLPALDWHAVAQGEIVHQDMPPLETEPAAIAVVFAAQVPAPLLAVLQQLQRPLPGSQVIEIDVGSADSIRHSLSAFAVSKDDDINLRWLRKPVADGTYNVSTRELKALQQNAVSLSLDPDQLGPLNQTLRELLAQRVEAYLVQGLSGIEPYDVAGKQIAAGDYLAGSMQPLALIRQKEADFYEAFLAFPQVQNAITAHYQSRFFLVIEDDAGQRILSLRHWVLDQREHSAVIAERKFYISHSLDAMHTLIYIEQTAENASQVVLGNTTFTQKVTGMGSFIAHKVGRAKIETTINPMLQSLQQAFE